MTSTHVGAVACGLILFGGVAAQDRPNPVRVRLTSEVYRAAQAFPDSKPGALDLDCNLLGAEYTTLRVQVGEPGAQAALLIAAQPGAVHYPGLGTLLVSPNAVAVHGVFDGAGVFEQPIDLARFGLAGQAVHVQAVQMSGGAGVAVSEGLAMRFTAGNHQPPSSYVGPPMTAIPCKAVDETIPTLYSVLLEFKVRQYEAVRLVDVFDVDEQTQAVVVELIPKTGVAVVPIAPPDVLRQVVDLGPFPKPLLEVWVAAPMWAPAEGAEDPGIDPPDATLTDAYCGDNRRSFKLNAGAPDGDGHPIIICFGPDTVGDEIQISKAEHEPGIDPPDATLTDAYCGDNRRSFKLNAGAPEGDGHPIIICFGPDTQGDVPQPHTAVTGSGIGARDVAPTDYPRDHHRTGPTVRLPSGWCIVFARAAVVDLRY